MKSKINRMNILNPNRCKFYYLIMNNFDLKYVFFKNLKILFNILKRTKFPIEIRSPESKLSLVQYCVL